MKNIIWNLKYRPSTVKNVVSPHTQTILKYLENSQSIPNFLFHSTIGGTGKTSMAKAIVKDLGCDYLMLNASEDRSIQTIREKVKHFARTQSSNGLKKAIVMDEGEKLTKDAADALKNMIEEYGENTFYIFTTNNISKINQPMQSRFVCYEFSQPDKHDIYTYLENICNSEKMNYVEGALNKLIDINYPSIRKCVNYLQDLKIQEKDVLINNIKKADEEFLKIWAMIKDKKFIELKKYLYENGTDCLMLNRWIFDNLFNEKFELKTLIKLVQLSARNEKEMKGADKTIIFIGTLPEMMSVL